LLCSFLVLSTIKLDDQLALAAEKVSEEGPNGLLSREAKSAKPAVLQITPQVPLRMGRIVAEGAGAGGVSGFKAVHTSS
jgi:hypothetical protein